MAPNVVQLQKARLELTKALQDLQKQIAALETAMKKGGDAVPAELKRMRDQVKSAGSGLFGLLDKALSESNETKRAAIYDKAGATARELVKFLDNDARIKALDKNPFAPFTARVATVKALVPLTRALG
jgi:hypothetical protein